MTSAALLTRDEIIRGLVAQGVPRDKAARAADEQLGAETGSIGVTLTETAPDPAAAVMLPLHLVLPWSALVSDNRKYAPTARRDSNGQAHPLLILRQEYREAKAKARSIARDALPAGVEPIAAPIALTARVFVPDNRRHDVVNFAKCVQDAFTEVVYADDCWLYANHWLRAGVDVDRPRAEITITLIQE